MKAILLNSGRGTRIAHITKEKPKCLIDLDANTTILSQQIHHFLKENIGQFIITTGPFAENVQRYVQKTFPGVPVNYVHNPDYMTTNYLYSLYLARGCIDDDVLLIHGDLIFDPEILRRLLQNPQPNCIPIDTSVPNPENGFNGRIEEGLVVEIGIGLPGKNSFFVPPFYKFSKAAFQAWLEEIGKLIMQKQYMVHAENALNTLTRQIPLAPTTINGLFCAEVDTQSDLDLVREYWQKNRCE